MVTKNIIYSNMRNFQLRIVDWLTILSIIIGPIFGVVLAIELEKRRSRRERRLDIFRTLMRTRRTPMWPEHVGSLNLVEIEFRNDKPVIEIWKRLFAHLGTPQPRHSREEINNGLSKEETRERNQIYGNRIMQERQKLLSLLLHAISNAIGFKIEQLEIFEGGYTPQGWDDVDTENSAVRRLFAEISAGKRLFPIGVFHFPGQHGDGSDDPNL